MSGWLFVFSISAVLGPLLNGYLVALFWEDAGALEILHPAAPLLARAALLANAALSLLLLIVWFRRSSSYRTIWLAVTVARILGLAVFLTGLGAGSDPGRLVTGLIGPAIFYAYMQMSRRYRVTFEAMVEQDDPILAAPTVPATTSVQMS